MDKLISIIIPVYRVEKWLKKCVNSVIRQTYKNLEIILVDDGSPDKCPQICDKLAKKDSRINVIHKENGGVSSARNAGIDASTGEYICFIDSDDWIDKNFIMNAYNDAISNGAQIVISNITIVSRRGERLYKTVNQTQRIDFNSEETLFAALQEELSLGGAVPKLYESSLIKDNNIKFDSKVKFGEDVLFLLKCFEFCDAVYLNTNTGYFYNRLVFDSAVLKFYSEICDWVELLTKAREALVAKKGNDFLYGDSYVIKSALIDFSFLVRYIVNNKSKEEAITQFEKAYSIFEKYVDKNSVEANDAEHRYCDEHIIELCYKKDFSSLYDYIEEEKPKMTIKRKMIRQLGKIYLCLKRTWYRYFDR